MKLSLSVQQPFQAPNLVLKRGYLKKVILTALQHLDIEQDCEIGIACVDEQQSQTLNATYRQKNKPTNVLSFPSEVPESVLPMLAARPLGDLVICIPVVLAEAEQQQKTALEHFSHMLVHGTLHLLGYDHETSEQDAEEMEALEIAILHKLGYDDPYTVIEP
ncbi:rRNA maturation RNase YbeY [Acinetobacter larvae]|uniref:Endoribonuclease YbeY n=1 Tax=Acinetobacter larvae TaxID=1789224 RepID=A0A1B2M483_9GAMM|nr:rRNA maturation RNase YbeY [Acinetobacter larvae]AOA60017.1 rRNA maturation RNase YbeY [Acinetobacter larvae]